MRDPIEQEILACIADAQAEGWKIHRSVWVEQATKECCALGACVRHGSTTYSWAAQAQEKLGLTAFELAGFIDGFDGYQNYFDEEPAFTKAFELGQRIAKAVFGS